MLLTSTLEKCAFGDVFIHTECIWNDTISLVLKVIIQGKQHGLSEHQRKEKIYRMFHK